MKRALPSPGLTWLPHRVAYCERFGDIYRSQDGALAETRHVFLNGCGLPEAWRAAESFVVCETGFGAGLNFMATYDLWQRTRPPKSRLHYISVEGYPLSHDELRECVGRWPELRHAAQDLMRVYLHPQPGFQRFVLDDGRIILTLLLGEAREMLAALEAQVDVWFLDGFSPEKNPAMWSAEVLGEVARLSKPGARLATYTAAGEVRRNLSAVGFDVSKVPGFGAKSEMTRGVFRGGESKSALPPWFAHAPVRHSLGRGRAAIIGAGLAGTAAAHALKRRGWTTTLIDRRAEIAEEASGNPVGVLMPRLTAAPSIDGRFYAAAWRTSLDLLEELADQGLALSRDRCGVLQLAVDGDEERMKAIAEIGGLPEPVALYVGANEASEIAGYSLPVGGVYFPQGGWLNPRQMCAAMARGAELALNAEVSGVRRAGALWEVLDTQAQVITQADVVIFANAMNAVSLPELAWLPLAARRGQLSFVAATPRSALLRCVLGYGGYITPVHRGRHCLGATFDWTEDALGAQTVSEEDHQRNTDDLAAALPAFSHGLSPEIVDGRAGIRCTTPDHLPVAGPVPDQAAYLRDFAELRHGHPWARYPSAAYHPGLYVLAGLGARGLTAAPLAAEIVACHITGEPWPVERDIAAALHPGRFLVRDLKRLKI